MIRYSKGSLLALIVGIIAIVVPMLPQVSGRDTEAQLLITVITLPIPLLALLLSLFLSAHALLKGHRSLVQVVILIVSLLPLAWCTYIFFDEYVGYLQWMMRPH